MKITFGKGLFLAVVSLAILATSCNTPPSTTSYEHADTVTVQKALDDNLGGIYENGDTGTYDICQRVPIRYANCTGDTVNGFRNDTRDTSVALLGDGIRAEELMYALRSRNVFLMHAEDKTPAPNRFVGLGWLTHEILPDLLWIIVILGLLLLLLWVMWASWKKKDDVQTFVHKTDTPAVAQVPNEFEGVYENGDTKMSIWIKGSRPEAFALSYKEGKNEPKTLSFKSKDEEEDAPPA